MSHRPTQKLNAALLAVTAPVFVGMMNPAHLRAQPEPAARVAFEVASIKPNTDPGPIRMGWEVHPGGRFRGTNLSLAILIAVAYNVPWQSQRLTGGPDWIGEARYDIDAAAEPGAIPAGLAGKALDARIRPMLQTLLAERFKLVIRRETKELTVYAITAGKNGPKLKPAAIEEKDCPGEPGTGVACHNLGGGMRRGLHGAAVDLDDVALFVANWTDRPVVNRSDLHGLYDIQTEGWGPMQPRQPRQDGSPDPEAESIADPSRPTVFMIFNQLGLKLEPQKAPIDMYVIEGVERPTAN
jgi:uncharacterized protein (TIGR03435 family)